MRKLYLLSVSNGLSYEDQSIEPLAVFSSIDAREKYIVDHSPITNELYRQIFKSDLAGYADPKYMLDIIWEVE